MTDENKRYKSKKQQEDEKRGERLENLVGDVILPSIYEEESKPAVSKKQKALISVEGNQLIYKGRTMDIKPYDELPKNFVKKIQDGEAEEVFDKKKLYLVGAGGAYMMQAPEISFDDVMALNVPMEKKMLILANINSSLVPVEAEPLEYDTFPEPLAKSIKRKMLWVGIYFALALALYLGRFLPIEVFWFWGAYALVYTVLSAVTFYLGYTRNFKMFSGIITNIHTTMPFSPSLRKSYVQISNGKKFLTISYKIKAKHIPVGTPITVFFSSYEDIVETEMGPTLTNYLAVSLSVETKAADRYGDYQDGKMKKKTVDDFFFD